MDRSVKTNVEPRKEWVAPELKKIDIEQITARNFGTGKDGGFGGFTKS